jgi:hypothetical protein
VLSFVIVFTGVAVALLLARFGKKRTVVESPGK